MSVSLLRKISFFFYRSVAARHKPEKPGAKKRKKKRYGDERWIRDKGKIFIGGISWETSEEKLKEYFGLYGDVLQTNILKDKTTNRPRGFGFVLFADPSVVDAVLRDQHTIDGRMVRGCLELSDISIFLFFSLRADCSG
ncbi:hypothetical protein Dimus_012969 [Dionaea muscipula]